MLTIQISGSSPPTCPPAERCGKTRTPETAMPELQNRSSSISRPNSRPAGRSNFFSDRAGDSGVSRTNRCQKAAPFLPGRRVEKTGASKRNVSEDGKSKLVKICAVEQSTEEKTASSSTFSGSFPSKVGTEEEEREEVAAAQLAYH